MKISSFFQLGTNRSPHLHGSKSPRWKFLLGLLDTWRRDRKFVPNCQLQTLNVRCIKSLKKQTSWYRGGCLKSRTEGGIFPLEIPRTFALKFPQTNFTYSHSSHESLLPHTCYCIHPNMVKSTWHSTPVFILQLNPDILTAVLMKIPSVNVLHDIEFVK